MDEAKVALLVLNYNTFEKSRRCIYSCISQKEIEGTVFVIDNNSTDDSLDKLKSEFGSSVQYLEFENNYGYAGGNNRAVSHVASMGYKYSFILNSDTELIGDTLCKTLLSGFNCADRCAVVAPQIFNVTSKGLILNTNRSTYLNLLIKTQIIPYKHVEYGSFESIPEAQGSALLVCNEDFIAIGGFPEDYFMYNEESTFAKKTLWDGYCILWYKSEDLFVKHHHDKSGKVDAWRVYLMGRNKAIEYYRYRDRAPIRWSIIYHFFLMHCKKNNIFGDYSSYKRGSDNAKQLIQRGASQIEFIENAKNAII